MKSIKQIIIAISAIVYCLANVETNRAAVILNGKLSDSKFYPGTVHTFKVSVPEGYKPGEEACLYLGLDGILCDAPNVIDSLIAAKAIPMTIGVYLQSGLVYDNDGNIVRYNRSNEFDATDTVFSEFLEKEVLPAVKNMNLPGGGKIKLKNGGENAMIFGLSSGGIAAFVTAWHRPDLFGKVFSGCGTFVPFRGGNDLQAIVRKHEPKPLRICLQDGYDDSWNPLFGSWFEANAMLGTALEFAGYDCWFDWGEGTHSVRRSSEIFPEVMKRMWQDYPERVKAGKTKNNFLAPLLEGTEEWETLTSPVAVPQQLIVDGNPAAVYPDGNLMAVATPGSNYMNQRISDGKGGWSGDQRFYWLHTYDNSQIPVWDMVFDGSGMLWVMTGAGLQVCDQNGRVRGILDYPRGFNPAGGRIVITENLVTLTARDGRAVSRRLNVPAAVKGVTPKSQGQG